jgi:heme-degrading monooxygenase HmoA
MFIAMNRFKVIKGSEAAFENVWLSRDSHLEKVPGFVEFHLLKGPEVEDHTVYASHTVWKNRATFEACTKSEAFRAAHASAGANKPLYLGHPQFEGFEVRLTGSKERTVFILHRALLVVITRLKTAMRRTSLRARPR